jgi:hypothetical protein
VRREFNAREIDSRSFGIIQPFRNRVHQLTCVIFACSVAPRLDGTAK